MGEEPPHPPSCLFLPLPHHLYPYPLALEALLVESLLPVPEPISIHESERDGIRYLNTQLNIKKHTVDAASGQHDQPNAQDSSNKFESGSTEVSVESGSGSGVSCSVKVSPDLDLENT